jgi:hypothetical protein
MSDVEDRDTPVIVNDPEKDGNTIRDGLMDELCRRQRSFEEDGGDERWNFEEVWQSRLSAFERGQYSNEIVEQYQNESGYFDIDVNDRISLTEKGKKYCRERQ